MSLKANSDSLTEMRRTCSQAAIVLVSISLVVTSSCQLSNDNVQLQYAIFEVPFATASTRVFVRNHSYKNEFYVEVHFHANQTHFHIKGLAL